MSQKIKRRIAAVTIFIVVLIYLSISISAIQFNSDTFLLYYVDSQTTTQRAFSTVTEYPLNMNLAGSPKTVYVAFKVNQVLTEGSIVVMQAEFGNLYGTSAELMGVGQPNRQLGSAAVPSVWESMPLNQRIIAFTAQNINANNYRFTVTFQASGFTSQYVYMRIDNILPVGGSTGTMTFANAELYDSVEDAAGSGTTPEEMREVLDSWAEENLIPGVEDAIQSGVQSGMEAALDEEKQQASSGAEAGLDELAGALSGVTDDINQAKQSFETLGAALSYSGTTASITFPAMTIPFLGTISVAQPINITQQIDSFMPPTLLLIIRCTLSLGIVSYPIIELIRQLRKLLDKE